MNNFEILNDLIEGSLKDAQEKSVYAELSSDSSMRQEMRSLLAVNNSINSNKALFVPNPASKGAIFGQLGLATATGAATASFWKSKVFYAIASSIATVLLMLGVYFGFMNGEDDTAKEKYIVNRKPIIELEKLDELAYLPIENKNAKVIPVTRAKRESSAGVENYTENVRNQSVGSNFDSAEKENIYIKENQLRINNNDISKDLAINKSNSDNYASNNLDISKNFENDILANNINPNNKFNRNVIEYNGFANNKKSSLGRFSLEWNNSESVHFPEERITPSQFAPFHNNSISLLYDVNQRLTLGANVRQETFYLVFSGLGDDGIQKIYEQQPNLTSFSGLMRYDLFEWQNDLPLELKTFTELQIGGNAIGPLGRVGFGFEIRPTQNITFVVSGNYSQLRYWHQNRGFRSEKFSLNYGVKFGF